MNYSKEGKMRRFLMSSPNDETLGDCLEVSFVVMLSQRQMDKMWDLVELLRFTADQYEGANAMMLIEAARQWRPVIEA